MKRTFAAFIALLLALSCLAGAEVLYPTIEVIEVKSTQRPVPVQTQDANEPSPAATAEPVKTTRLGFEDGFSLELPEGWLVHRVDADMAADGVIYCLSDPEGVGFLYIQSLESDCPDTAALKDLIDRTSKPQVSDIYNFNGKDFVVYDLSDSDVSCCAALMNGRMLNFVFTPQSNSEFMGVAARIIGSFALLETK